jgi:hypothetical protein
MHAYQRGAAQLSAIETCVCQRCRTCSAQAADRHARYQDVVSKHTIKRGGWPRSALRSPSHTCARAAEATPHGHGIKTQVDRFRK